MRRFLVIEAENINQTTIFNKPRSLGHLEERDTDRKSW
jgi:hypothetical protein